MFLFLGHIPNASFSSSEGKLGKISSALLSVAAYQNNADQSHICVRLFTGLQVVGIHSLNYLVWKLEIGLEVLDSFI